MAAFRGWQGRRADSSSYIYESIYTISITCIKVSILLFYSRIFKERPFQIALWLTLGVTLAWFVAVELAVIFECHPIYALWTFTPNACVDLHKFVIGSGVPNVLLNTVILMLPVPMIWTLDIQNRHKLVLSGVFMLGGLSVHRPLPSSVRSRVPASSSCPSSG
jgi:hypothetical protein